MPSPLHHIEAHLLGLAPHAGDHLVLTCFSPAEGLLTALLRPTRKAASAAPTPDLFDRLALELNRARGATDSGPWFVREHRVLARHSAIGRDYATLAAASRLARVVMRNPVPEDSRAAIDELLARAFAAFARVEARADLVFFKSLYCLARDEGLPLKQQWLPSLPPGDRALVGSALSLPPDAAECPAPADVLRVTKRLEAYLVSEAELTLG
jgi:hypothetical protein